MKIVFTGGGTMGSVVPLLAVIEHLKQKDPSIDYLWIGTRYGPEKQVVVDYNIDFKHIFCGKLRRYFSFRNIIDVFYVIFGFLQSLLILKKFRPRVIVSAGGFVAVPVVWAGWFLGIKSFIHQQDVRPGLSNKLCAWCAEKITVCFASSAAYFNEKKILVVGNPVRESFRREFMKADRNKLLAKYNFKQNLPIVLITAGGRGSLLINDIVLDSLDELTKICQIAHITGRNRSVRFARHKKNYANYREYEFMIDDINILRLADLVVSRAGMSTLTELTCLGKPSIIIPIPDSHQEDNARYFAERGAVEILEQKNLEPGKFIASIKEILCDKQKIKNLAENIHHVIKFGAGEKIVRIIGSI